MTLGMGTTMAKGAAGTAMMMMSGIVVAAAVGGALAGALGVYAAQRLMKRGGGGFGGSFGSHAHNVDGSDATASFDAGIADQNTVPGRSIN